MPGSSRCNPSRVHRPSPSPVLGVQAVIVADGIAPAWDTTGGLEMAIAAETDTGPRPAPSTLHTLLGLGVCLARPGASPMPLFLPRAVEWHASLFPPAHTSGLYGVAAAAAGFPARSSSPHAADVRVPHTPMSPVILTLQSPPHHRCSPCEPWLPFVLGGPTHLVPLRCRCPYLSEPAL